MSEPPRKKRITVRALPQTRKISHNHLVASVNLLTADVLSHAWTTPNEFSFEDCYRLMFNFQLSQPSEDASCKAISFLYQCFVTQKWHSRRNWEALHDCWLYPIRTNKHGNLAKLTFEHILSTIDCYPILLSFIFAQYQVPPDIQRVITKQIIS